MRSPVNSWTVLAAAALLLLAAGCPQAARWRDAQIAQSQRLAQGQRVTPPAQPISIPKAVREELPLDDSFTITEFSGSAGNRAVTVAGLSAWDTESTALWMIRKLGQLGYESDENPSEILNGAEYYHPKRRYRRLVVTVTMNTADQCILRLEASES